MPRRSLRLPRWVATGGQGSGCSWAGRGPWAATEGRLDKSLAASPQIRLPVQGSKVRDQRPTPSINMRRTMTITGQRSQDSSEPQLVGQTTPPQEGTRQGGSEAPGSSLLSL